MKFTVVLEADDITSRLQSLGPRGQKAAKDVITKKVAEIAVLAKPIAPLAGGALAKSIRSTKATITGAGIVSGAAIAGGSALVGLFTGGGRNASAHVRAYRKAMAKTRAFNVYGLVQELGQERTRSGGVATLRHTHGQSHFMETSGLKVAVTVPDAVLDRLDQEEARA